MDKKRSIKIPVINKSQAIMGLIIIILLSYIMIVTINNKNIENDDIFLNAYKKSLNEGNFERAIELLDEEITVTTELKANSHLEALIFYLQEDITNNNEEYEEIIELAKGNNVNYENMDVFYSKMPESGISKNYEYIRNTLRTIVIPQGEDKISYLSYVEIDYLKILESYGDYVSDDLKGLLKIGNEEFISLINANSNEINYDKALSNILIFEEFIENYPESPYILDVKDNLAYHYQSYLGYYDWGNVYINNSLSINAKKNYTETIEAYPDTTIANKLAVYMEALEVDDFKKTPNVEILLLELIKTDRTDDVKVIE